MLSMLARLRGWVRRQPLYPGQTVVRPWPRNLHEQDRAFFALNHTYELPPSWLLHLREVSLQADGAAFHGLRLYPETLVVPAKPIHNWRGLLHVRLRLRRHRLPANRPYLLAFDSWSVSYYHWMVDALPRLLAVRAQLAGLTVLLPDNYRETFHTQTLQALGVRQVEWLHPHVRYVVPYLLAPARLARVASYNPAVMRELRELLLAKFAPLPQADLGERIYVSRARATRRKVLNEDAVLACLRPLGFAVVNLEEYEFAEQVSIMRRAKYLVSIHGAGLTNILFMAPGSSVLELQMQDDGASHYYYTLAADLGINYYYQFCPPSDPALTVQDADLTVDVTELAQTVTQMLII